jgi:DNA-binding NarL/FixJ family response regulator
VIADDHPIWRTGVRTDLGENFHVVAEAADAAEATAAIRAQRPDVVLCDLHMPEGGGLRVARECGTTTKVVILTVSEAERRGGVGRCRLPRQVDATRRTAQRALEGRAR